jgi:heme exporter protein C
VRVFDWMLALSVVAVAAAIVRAIWFTPPEALQGDAQKIFYIHVPAAVVGLYLACPLVAIGVMNDWTGWRKVRRRLRCSF